MFTKVLIANRGEIACRLIRTLDRLKIASVAVYSDADAQAAHVVAAGEAVHLGPAPATESYLRGPLIIEAALKTGAQAIHPGYGFLSENPEFASMCADAGLTFIGPTPDQMRSFGLKHTARELAHKCGVPMAPGSGLLETPDAAMAAARKIGLPVMLKATAGGGGIGMRLCRAESELADAFAAVQRLGKNNFKHAGLYLEKYIERARHIEVQIFGDGQGTVLALGERDCSAQRRNQKVIEETPAPNLTDDLRQSLFAAAVKLGESVGYQSAGTVEFIFDDDTKQFYFLEVNTRLQVEHAVTELVTGIDLVEWMIRQAAGELSLATFSRDPKGSASLPRKPRGHSIQVRLYAEDPAKNFQPSCGVITDLAFPSDARVDTWAAPGTEVSSFYDPLVAKIIVHGDTRADAVAKLRAALDQTHVYGIETNLEYLREILDEPTFVEGRMITQFLSRFHYAPHTIDILKAGTQTTVQDFPGRLGYWAIGVPPSGPMDSLAFRLANRILDNPPTAAGLELTVSGPTLRFNLPTTIAITGADMKATLDGQPVPLWTAIDVPSGATLDFKAVQGPGCRTYIAFKSGLDVPHYLHSQSTFTLGKFGGHGGRALRPGDVLRLHSPSALHASSFILHPSLRPTYSNHWTLSVLYGPHGAPDFFTDDDIQTLFSTDYKVHHHSDRTGIRLIGPHPKWARTDGGEAGLHPSNIHDNAYAVGTIDFTGNLPIILGPDGPSLGGFVCPATIVNADLWKIGQLKPGDSLRFVPITQEQARTLEAAQEHLLTHVSPPSPSPSSPGILPCAGTSTGQGGGPSPTVQSASPSQSIAPLSPSPGTPGEGRGEGSPSTVHSASPSPGATGRGTPRPVPPPRGTPSEGRGSSPRSTPLSPIIHSLDTAPRVVYRQDGDKYLLVEYGPLVLDLNLRFRVHALMLHLEQLALPGIIDLTPGIRSLHIHYDSRILPLDSLMDTLIAAEPLLPDTDQMEVPTRIVHLPLSWDDPACQLAIQKYMQVVRKDAPWCPSNLEFIRRINGLNSIGDVHRIVFDASYLVLGLGDVYLGAPVATPIDPRHRLVTTKYNPARTWTAENSVGIGGAYLCVYGMEGPGGYQFVGRTCQMWNTYRQTADFTDRKPWLLRFFDQIRFYPVSASDLLRFRQDFLTGRVKLKIEHETFRLRDYNRFLETHRSSIAAFKSTQQQAFEAERAHWEAAGLANFSSEPAPSATDDSGPASLPAGAQPIFAEVPGNVWKVEVQKNQRVKAGQTLAILESMKTEIAVPSPSNGVVGDIFCSEGKFVPAGQLLFSLLDG